MPRNPIIEPEGGVFVSTPVRLPDNSRIEDRVRELELHVDRLVKQINGRLSLAAAANSERVGHMNAQRLDVTFPSSADTLLTHPHGLERVPVGFAVVDRDRACIVYRDEEWSEDVVKLKCDTASAEVVIYIW